MRVRSRTTVLFVAVALAGTLAAAAPVSAAPASAPTRTSTVFPTTFALPDGFQPEGIAIGALPYAFFGSRADGDIYRVSLLTGRGEVIKPGSGPVAGPQGRPARAALRRRRQPQHRRGRAGSQRVHRRGARQSTSSAPCRASSTTWCSPPDAAWFTDSTNPVLYKLPLDRRGGLPDAGEVVTLPLTGDIVYGAGINANGIATTPDGRGLLIVQSNTGLLFRVDPATGVTRTVDLGGELLTNGDGLLAATAAPSTWCRTG